MELLLAKGVHAWISVNVSSCKYEMHKLTPMEFAITRTRSNSKILVWCGVLLQYHYTRVLEHMVYRPIGSCSCLGGVALAGDIVCDTVNRHEREHVNIFTKSQRFNDSMTYIHVITLQCSIYYCEYFIYFY